MKETVAKINEVMAAFSADLVKAAEGKKPLQAEHARHSGKE